MQNTSYIRERDGRSTQESGTYRWNCRARSKQDNRTSVYNLVHLWRLPIGIRSSRVIGQPLASAWPADFLTDGVGISNAYAFQFCCDASDYLVAAAHPRMFNHAPSYFLDETYVESVHKDVRFGYSPHDADR